MTDRDGEEPVEIAIVGDLTDSEADLTDRLLGIEPGGECTIYFDSPGGSPYCAVSLMTLIKLRNLRATGIVTGECSSATLWPFAACTRSVYCPGVLKNAVHAATSIQSPAARVAHRRYERRRTIESSP